MVDSIYKPFCLLRIILFYKVDTFFYQSFKLINLSLLASERKHYKLAMYQFYMENKKLGILLIIISLVVGGMFVYYNSTLIKQSKERGCFPNEECIKIESTLNFSHFAIGIFSFILALGFYLIFFNKTEKAILNKLEEDKNKNIEDNKFNILLKALDEHEKKVIKAVREQPGITQNTLRLRTDMSKAKLSYVLQELERREIIKRIEKGKTLEVYLKV